MIKPNNQSADKMTNMSANTSANLPVITPKSNTANEPYNVNAGGTESQLNGVLQNYFSERYSPPVELTNAVLVKMTAMLKRKEAARNWCAVLFALIFSAAIAVVVWLFEGVGIIFLGSTVLWFISAAAIIIITIVCQKERTTRRVYQC